MPNLVRKFVEEGKLPHFILERIWVTKPTIARHNSVGVCYLPVSFNLKWELQED